MTQFALGGLTVLALLLIVAIRAGAKENKTLQAALLAVSNERDRLRMALSATIAKCQALEGAAASRRDGEGENRLQ